MADVFIVFGSASDEPVFRPLLEQLKKTGISYEFKVLSAHKTPKELEFEINNTNASIFIAGAGLSAALPGVIASKRLNPVIGLPCDAAFSGLDSYISALQMPPDVPVITVGVGKTSEAVRLCSNYLHGFKQIALVVKKTGEEKKYSEKCKSIMEENKIPFIFAKNSKKHDYSRVFIEFVKVGKKVPKTQNITIIVPVKEGSKKQDSLKVFDMLQGSYAVGLNNHKNAALAALELLNLSGTHSGLLSAMRQTAAKKINDVTPSRPSAEA